MNVFGRLGKTAGALVAVVALVLVAVIVYFSYQQLAYKRYTAYFSTTNALYAGDPVKVLGVPVGKVTSIKARSGDVKVQFKVDDDVDLPKNVRAVIVAQNLVSGRFIQLDPAYNDGPKLGDGGDIPMSQTAVPVEWDQIKTQLTQLSEALGPNGTDRGVADQTLNTAAKNLDGNGADINSSIHNLAAVMGTLSNSRGDLFATVRSLQALTNALSGSHDQLVQFNGRIASVSQVLANDTPQINGAMNNLSTALTDLKTFLGDNSSALTDTVDKLSNFTRILSDKNEQISGLLHSAPNQLQNFYNIYAPLQGALMGVFSLPNGGNLIDLICGSIAGADRNGQQGDAQKCVDRLGPMLTTMAISYPPFVLNPVMGINGTPNDVTYQNNDVKRRAQQREAIQNQAIDGRNAGVLPPQLSNLILPRGAR